MSSKIYYMYINYQNRPFMQVLLAIEFKGAWQKVKLFVSLRIFVLPVRDTIV